MNVQVEGGSKKQLQPVCPVHVHRFMRVAPLVAGGMRHRHAHSFQRPATANDGQEPMPVFIEHPQPRRPLARLSGGGVQAGGQFPFAGFRLGRVFLGASLARHLQDSAGFSRQRMDTAGRQGLFCARLDPGLRLLRPAELAELQLLGAGRVVGATQGGIRAPAVAAGEQGAHAAAFHRVQVVEGRGAGDADGVGNLPRTPPVLGDEPEDEQPFSGPFRLGLRPGARQFRHVFLPKFPQDSCQAVSQAEARELV